MKLSHVKRSGPVFLRHSVYQNRVSKMWGGWHPSWWPWDIFKGYTDVSRFNIYIRH